MSATEAEPHADLSDRERLLGLIAAIIAISVAAAGFGHSTPLFSVLLKHYEASNTFVGFNSAVGALAIILSAPFFPALISRLSLKRFMVICVLMMIISYQCLFLAGDEIWLWYPLRFVFSLGAAGLFAGSELWISTLARDDNRGAVIGIYGTCLALGFALGPFLLGVTGYYTVWPFIGGIIVFSIALIPMLIAKAPEIRQPEKTPTFFPLVRLAPVTFLASAVFGSAEAAILAFLPIMAIDWGFGETISARVVTVYALGGISLQYLLGKYSDSLGRLRTLTGCTIIALVGALLFPVMSGQLPTLYLLLFAWGAFITGISTVGLAGLGDAFKGERMAAANTGYVFMYGAGALAGPALAGLARDAYGDAGLQYTLLFLFGIYLALIFRRRHNPSP